MNSFLISTLSIVLVLASLMMFVGARVVAGMAIVDLRIKEYGSATICMALFVMFLAAGLFVIGMAVWCWQLGFGGGR